MKIGVGGASGELGGAVVKYLLEQSNGDSVVAISKNIGVSPLLL